MRQSKGIVQSFFGLPITAITALVNLESDWIRYGVPAVLLTAIFFIAMRYQAAEVYSPSVKAPSTGRVQPSEPTSFSALPGADAGGAKMPDRNSPPGGRFMPRAAPQINQHPPQPAGWGAAALQGHPPTAVLPEEQSEGRRDLCVAVGYVVNAGGKHRRSKALRFAVASYQGKGGPQAADRAVNAAVSDYALGKWSEDACPVANGKPLPKGSIGEVMR